MYHGFLQETIIEKRNLPGRHQRMVRYGWLRFGHHRRSNGCRLRVMDVLGVRLVAALARVQGGKRVLAGQLKIIVHFLKLLQMVLL